MQSAAKTVTEYLAELTKMLEDMWAAAGKKLDMGKGCIRFKKFDDVVPEAIAMVIERCTPSYLWPST